MKIPSYNKSHSVGFTLVEIVLIVAIVSVLLTITFMNAGRIQAGARDKTRESNATLIAERLEKYFDKHGEYPGIDAVTGDIDTASSTLGDIDKSILITPKAPNSTTNSIIEGVFDNGGGADVYGYSATCDSDIACNSWVLEYQEEATGTIKSIESRRDVAAGGTSNPDDPGNHGNDPTPPDDSIEEEPDFITAPDAPAIDVTFSSPDSVVAFVVTPAACERGTPQYKVRDRTNQGSWSNWSNYGTAATLMSVPAIGETTYGVQAVQRCVDGSTVSEDSPTTDEIEYYHPSDAYTPGVSVRANVPYITGRSTTVLCDDGSVPRYQFHWRQEGGMWSSWSSWSTDAFLNVTGVQGVRFEFQARARCGETGTPSADSNIGRGVYPILAPAVPTITTRIYGRVVRGTISPATCPAGTTAEYHMQVRYNSNRMGSYNSWSTSRVRDMTAYYGARHSFRAQARCVNILTTGAAATSAVKDHIRGFVKLKVKGGTGRLKWNNSTDKYYWSPAWTFTHPSPTSKMSIKYGGYQCRKHVRNGSWGAWSSDWGTSPNYTSKCGIFRCSTHDYFQVRYRSVQARSPYTTGPSIAVTSNAARCN